MKQRVSKSWDDYYLDLLDNVASRSKDPDTQVGAIIVDKNNKQIGMGYNGFPPKFPDTEEYWKRPTKYRFVVHAEMNAIFNSLEPVNDCTLYVPFYPCADCAKNIAGARISRIVIDTEYYQNETTDLIFKECNIEVTVRHKGQTNKKSRSSDEQQDKEKSTTVRETKCTF